EGRFGRDPGGQGRHLRHEAESRRPDRGRDERGRGRDHREAGGNRLMEKGYHDFKARPGRKKVTVIGAGNVGTTAAQEVARRDYADVVLVDIIENLPQGKALDLNEAAPVLGYEPAITGSNGYEATAGSDVVVVTSGKPRSPGMSRDDLVATN